jgi:hypothetical protein
MFQRIQVGNDTLEFPNDMPDDQISAVIQREYGQGGQQSQVPTQPEIQPQQTEGFQARNRRVAGQFVMGLPNALGNALIGGVQAGADLGDEATRLIDKVYFGNSLEGEKLFGKRLAEQVKLRNQQQAKLPAAERAGIAVGQVVPYLASGVGTGMKVATATGSKILGLATTGTISGAVSSALSPQEEAGLQNRAIKTAKGAAVGSAVGGGLGVIGKVASTVGGGAVQLGKDVLAGYKARPAEAIAGFTSKPVETLDSISATIKEGSSNAYKAMREAGAILKPQTTKSIFMNIDDSLKESGILNPRLHGDTIGVLDDLKALSKEKNGAIGLEELDQYRQLLGDVVKKNTDIAGKINADALKANIAINKLDDVVEGLGGKALIKGDKKSLDLLNTARQEWGRYRKFDTITNIVKKADGDANRTKTLLQNFVNNPKNLRGFSPTEVQALKRAKTNSTAEGLMKGLGKFGFDLGSGRNVGNTALPIGSILIGGGTGGLTAAVGTIARQAQKLSARGQIDDVLRLIQGQEPKIASKVIQQLSPKTRDLVLTNILTQSINQTNN